MFTGRANTELEHLNNLANYLAIHLIIGSP